MFVVDIA